jgi:hypothetical protein
MYGETTAFKLIHPDDYCLLACDTTTSPPSVSRFVDNVGASTSHNPIGLHGLLQGYLYLFLPMFLNSLMPPCSRRIGTEVFYLKTEAEGSFETLLSTKLHGVTSQEIVMF